jgi:hypothetical protein
MGGGWLVQQVRGCLGWRPGFQSFFPDPGFSYRLYFQMSLFFVAAGSFRIKEYNLMVKSRIVYRCSTL